MSASGSAWSAERRVPRRFKAARALLPDDHAGKRQAPITSKDDSQMFREAARIGNRR